MAWNDLAEMAPLLSEAEVRFEKRRRLLGLVLGPLLFVAILLMSPLEHVTPVGMRTLAIFVWVVIWWVTEPLPIPATAFLGLALLVLMGILNVAESFNYWANWVNIFLMGAMIIGHAMSLHGLTQRLAYKMLASKLLGGSPWRLLVAFAIGPAVLSSIMSNVVTAIIFLSIGLGLVKTLRLSRENRYGEALFVCIAWGAGMGGIITPPGSPPNLISIGLLAPTGYRIGFLQWMMVGVPIALLGMVGVLLIIRYVMKPQLDGLQTSSTYVQEQLRRLGPMNAGEKISAVTLAVAIFLWMLPDTAPLFLEGGRQHPVSVWLTRHLDWSVSAIIVATALFLIPVDWKERRFAMTWPEAVKGVEWGTLALIGSALAMGNLIAHRELGLGAFFAAKLADMATGGASHMLIVLISIFFAVALTNLASNVAISSMVGTLALAIGPSAGINPVALVVCAGIASSMAFSLPISTPPNAIVFASGQVRVGTMLRSGTLLSLLMVLIIWLLGFPLAEWVFPWTPAAP
ncbi:MAG: SLC13/DASS family transporter [Acidobacteria bacterium]|nr:SLC13/DASS family transporter [Acidobacteriota bacterium]